MLCLWTIEIQCLTQIMANRISLLLYTPAEKRRLKLWVAAIIGVFNVAVFIIWIPARLQISPTWIHANAVGDRIGKCVFLIVDLTLNVMFIRLVKSQLIAQGLTKYTRVYRFNLLMMGVSIALDVCVPCCSLLEGGMGMVILTVRLRFSLLGSCRCRTTPCMSSPTLHDGNTRPNLLLKLDPSPCPRVHGQAAH
jgi:hypothetical protein